MKFNFDVSLSEAFQSSKSLVSDVTIRISLNGVSQPLFFLMKTIARIIPVLVQVQFY